MRAHKITIAGVQAKLDQFLLLESATTVDCSQRKHLEVLAGAGWRVRRSYVFRFIEVESPFQGSGEDPDWDVIYEGPDLAEAVRLYNSLK